MKKSIKKLLSLFLAFSIVLGNLLSVFPASDSEESTNTTLKVDMRVINLEGDGTINEETDFWVDKTINSAADISVSGTGSKITNPWIVVTVPKVSIINKPTFIDSQNAYQSLKLEDDSNYYILYKFNEITGGMRSTFPFPFKFDKVQAKNGDTVTVKMDMLDANTVDDKVSTDSGKMISLIGSLPKLYSVQKTYKAIKDDLEISISMAFIDKGNQTIADSTPSSTGKDRTVSDIHNAIVNINSPDVTSTTNEKVPIRFSYGIDTSKITGTTITHRPVEQIVTTVKVPDGATLSEASIKAGWVYNEQDRTATKIQNNPRIESSSWYYYYGARVTDLELLFSVPFNTVHEIPVELKYKYEGEEEKTLPELTLRIQFTPRVFTPGHSFRVFKDNLTNYGTTADGVKYWISEGKYVYYGDRLYDKTFDHTDVGLFYTINVDNNNNGSSTTSLENGIVSNIFKIEDVLSRTNEHKIYYDTFSIADIYKNNGNLSNDAYIKKSEQLKNQINSIPNVLYGITDSGEKIKIAENIKYQKKVNINDTSKRFAKLSLEFSEPLTLDNIGLSLYSLAKPTEEELENFKNGNYLSRQYYYGLANAYQNSAINPSSDINSANYVTDVYHFGETSIGTIDPRAHLANSLDKTTVPYVASGTYLMYSTDAYLRADYGIWGTSCK
ncbi:hypothetical protein [Peptostreptococcus porci]|uniref:hypothetical protein n=1 Tax=Peptostreptococcus porci TaxID=2652282 RepID=UPI002A91C594|nr:hypothetical protein [Peptostreptococcus porci]MDY5435976.1 hypothetical protein [Peptostreptococcus porci]